MQVAFRRPTEAHFSDGLAEECSSCKHNPFSGGVRELQRGQQEACQDAPAPDRVTEDGPGPETETGAAPDALAHVLVTGDAAGGMALGRSV